MAEKILTVDDEPDIRGIIRRVLNRAGYEVIEAGGGMEALEIMTEQEVDLVLLDVMMPEMDGYDTLQEIRKNPKYNTLPVVMLTAKNTPQDRMNSFKCRSQGHIGKPISNDRLLTTLELVLKKK